jgi:hypothetical protein
VWKESLTARDEREEGELGKFWNLHVKGKQAQVTCLQSAIPFTFDHPSTFISSPSQSLSSITNMPWGLTDHDFDHIIRIGNFLPAAGVFRYLWHWLCMYFNIRAPGYRGICHSRMLVDEN